MMDKPMTATEVRERQEKWIRITARELGKKTDAFLNDAVDLDRIAKLLEKHGFDGRK